MAVLLKVITIVHRCDKAVDLNMPFGIKYSLTLHDPKGERIIGYDNAHRVPYLSAKTPFDHMHKGGKIRRYEYKDAVSLMEDFWKDVDRIIKEEII